MISRTNKAAIFHEAGKPLSIESAPLPDSLEPGAILCRVRMSTICGSDLHTTSGRRIEPTPCILGHEAAGEVVELGPLIKTDFLGRELKPGDRITWSIMACCNECFFCQHDLPQKCTQLRKYGHMQLGDFPHSTGGYAQYIYLMPGTTIIKLPDSLPDEVATPANCALSTATYGVNTIGLHPGESVLIQGAGLLGLNLTALAHSRGASMIIVTDVSADRLQMAARFGAHQCIDVSTLPSEEVIDQVRNATNGHGVDVAYEVCGIPEATHTGIAALRTGGRYLMAGLVMAGSILNWDADTILRKCLSIAGIHNYRPTDLQQAIDFLKQNHQDYPFHEIVGNQFPLDQINEAISAAMTQQSIRVAITL